MKLYVAPYSPSCKKVLVLSTYLELDVEIIKLNFQAGDLQNPEFLKMNPNGKVPVLDDDGFYLWESNAILEYLCRNYGGEELSPQDPMTNAMMKQWLFWEAAHFNGALNDIVYEGFIKVQFKLGPTDRAAYDRASQRAMKHCALLDKHLEELEYVCTDLSIVDFALASQIDNAIAANFPMQQFPNIMKWNERIKAIPAWSSN